MLLLLSLLIIGWVAASIVGTQVYVRGEQTQPMHVRNITAESFARLLAVMTGRGADLSEPRATRPVDV